MLYTDNNFIREVKKVLTGETTSLMYISDLLKNGISPDVLIKHDDIVVITDICLTRGPVTAIYLALIKCNYPLIALLVKHNATITSELLLYEPNDSRLVDEYNSPDFFKLLNFLISNEPTLDDFIRKFSLREAIICKLDIRRIKYLVSKGASIDYKGDEHDDGRDYEPHCRYEYEYQTDIVDEDDDDWEEPYDKSKIFNLINIMGDIVYTLEQFEFTSYDVFFDIVVTTNFCASNITKYGREYIQLTYDIINNFMDNSNILSLELITKLVDAIVGCHDMYIVKYKCEDMFESDLRCACKMFLKNRSEVTHKRVMNLAYLAVYCNDEYMSEDAYIPSEYKYRDAMHYAVHYVRLDIIKFFVSEGCKVFIGENMESVLHTLMENRSNLLGSYSYSRDSNILILINLNVNRQLGRILKYIVEPGYTDSDVEEDEYDEDEDEEDEYEI